MESAHLLWKHTVLLCLLRIPRISATQSTGMLPPSVPAEQRDAGPGGLTPLELVWARWPAVCAWTLPSRQSGTRCGRAGQGWHRPVWPPQRFHTASFFERLMRRTRCTYPFTVLPEVLPQVFRYVVSLGRRQETPRRGAEPGICLTHESRPGPWLDMEVVRGESVPRSPEAANIPRGGRRTS